MSEQSARFEANPEQAEYWNGAAGQKWVTHDDAMETRLHPVADELLRRAAISAGENVLEIGCGAGATTARIAERVGREGRVLGVDISEPMLEAARKRCANVANVAFENADAQAHRFEPPAFDRLISRFGVMFFKDPHAAFANLASALNESAPVDFVCWAPAELNPWFMVPLEAAVRHLGPPDPPTPRAPGPLAFSEPGYVSEILTGAGFRSVDVEAFEIALGGPEPAREQAELYLKLGPASRLIAAREATPETIETITRELAAELAGRERDGRIALPGTVYYVSARR